MREVTVRVRVPRIAEAVRCRGWGNGAADCKKHTTNADGFCHLHRNQAEFQDFEPIFPSEISNEIRRRHLVGLLSTDELSGVTFS